MPEDSAESGKGDAAEAEPRSKVKKVNTVNEGAARSKQSAAKTGTRGGSGGGDTTADDDVAPEWTLVGRLSEFLDSVAEDVGERMRRLAVDATDMSISVGRAFLGRPQNAGMAEEAGAYVRELRELAGLTREELSDAISLEDRTLLKAVEEGAATLSFELVLRLAAILARHDPVPFLIRLTRTYNPEVWRVLEDFGVGRLPLHFERERRFINVYRRHDAARKLSDDGFEHVLDLTRSAFDLALHFVAEQESIEDHVTDPEASPESTD